MKKVLAFAFLSLFLASFLSAQSVADLAKKEKERRAAIKGKPTVITNADLAKVKKKPAVEVAAPEKPLDQTLPEGQAAGQEGKTPPATAEQTAPKADEANPAPQTSMSERDFREKYTEAKSKVDQAQEQVDLNTLKMNGLQQQFYDLRDMKSRELIQLQISQTYDNLTKAQLDLDKAKKELDNFLATAKRAGVPSVWIR